MARGNAPDLGAGFNQRSDGDQALEAARERKLAEIRARLQNEHTSGRTPVSVSRIEQKALEDMASKPAYDLDLTPGNSAIKTSNREREQQRQGRLTTIRNRLREIAETRSLSRGFRRGGDGYDP